MAKKKVIAKKKGKASVEPKANQGKKTSRKSALLFVVLALFLAFIGFEIFMIMQNSAIQAKRPVLVKSFDRTWVGVTSLGVYGEHIYYTDRERAEIRQIDKNDGKLIKIVVINNGAINTVEDSAGNVYVLSGQNSVAVLNQELKEIKRIQLKGITNANWMDIDDSGNFYFCDDQAGKVIKYDKDMANIILTIGEGRGVEKGQFIGIGKLHLSAAGNIYVTDYIGSNKLRMNVFDKTGKFKKRWNIVNVTSVSIAENFTVTPDNYVYVNNFEGGNILVFNPNGRYMGSWNSDVTKSFAFNYPVSICGGPTGLIYVSVTRLAVFLPIKY